MVRRIITVPQFLSCKSSPATAADRDAARDLLDTLMAHSGEIGSMAAPMIGVRRCIIAFLDESGDVPVYAVILNPGIVGAQGEYEAEERFEAIGEVRKCRRFREIRLKYRDFDMKERVATYSDRTAARIQHAMDYCRGLGLDREH